MTNKSSTEEIFENFNEPLIDRKTAARFLNMKPETLAVWDCTKRYDLKPLRIGNRKEALLKHASRMGNRTSAIELMNYETEHKDYVLMQERTKDQGNDHKPRKDKQPIHDNAPVSIAKERDYEPEL